MTEETMPHHAFRASRAPFLAAAALVVGCSSGDNVTVGTSAARGAVGGVVLDAAPGLPPLASASVTVIAGGSSFPTTTDMNGVFAVHDVPSGSVLVELAAPGHLDVYLHEELPAAAGNFPASNALTVGPIAMAGSGGTLKLRVVDEVGAPATGIKVIARSAGYVDLASAPPMSGGTIEAGATTSSDGTATIAGLPDFAAAGPILDDHVTVAVPPATVMSASPYEFLGLEEQVQARQLGADDATSSLTLVLAGPHTPLTVLASNLDWLLTGVAGAVGSLVSTAGPIDVVFNQAVNQASVRAELLDENGAPVAAPATTSATGNAVTVTLTGKPLDPATRYNLSLHVDALGSTSKSYDALAPFFTPPPATAGAVTIASSSGIDPNNTNDFILEFSEPIGLGSGSTSSIPCVVFYEADLDGNSQVTSAGEWNANGNGALRCETDGSHPGFYLRPDEPTFAVNHTSPVTGFSSRWRITVRPLTAVCWNGYQCCIGNGGLLHLVFSRNTDPGFRVKRVDGSSVPDIAPFMLSFGCP
jgi:hypothetical protein